MNTTMTTAAEQASHQPATTPAASPFVRDEDRQRGPMWRIVVGSVATGFVGALALTVGAFGGAPEHVITASALLAFAAGWAMLAVLTTRFTNRPQRWAMVPAAFLAVAGLAVAVFQPGDAALNGAVWVWGPLTLVLAGWTFTRIRRGLDGRVRWVLYPVAAVLLAGSLGGMYETVAQAGIRDEFAAPGAMYDVGGHRLHIDCVGTGTPTVVLQNGLAETSPFWARITAEVGRSTRVCAYDRAGQGWSDDVDAPQDGLAIATDLHTLLQRAGETGPYVLVGHSAPGAYSMVYAAQYPDEVAGMVLLDSMSPYQFTMLPSFAGEYTMMRRMVGVLPSLARVGAAQLVPESFFSKLPEPAASQVAAFTATARGLRNVRDEQSMYHEVFAQAQRLTTLGAKPLVVVTATESLDEIEGWAQAQARIAALSSNSRQRVVDATHEGLLDDPTTFVPSVQAIDDVVDAVRAGQS